MNRRQKTKNTEVMARVEDHFAIWAQFPFDLGGHVIVDLFEQWTWGVERKWDYKKHFVQNMKSSSKQLNPGF